MEFLYDWLDSGESLEGLAIRVDIAAAGRGLSQSHHDVWREGLEIIRIAREQGAGRNEVMAFLRRCEQKLNRGFGGETGEKSE